MVQKEFNEFQEAVDTVCINCIMCTPDVCDTCPVRRSVEYHERRIDNET